MGKIKKHKLISAPHINDPFQIIGIITDVSIVKFVFDFNLRFPVKFALNKNAFPVIINGKEENIPLYVSLEKRETDPVIYIFNHQFSIENKDDTELFPVENTYYLFPNLKKFHFFMFIPSDYNFNTETLKEGFKPGYFTYFEKIKMENFKPFPFFPKVQVYS